MTKRLSIFIAILGAIFIVVLASYFFYLLLVSGDQTRLAVLTATVSVGTLIYTQLTNTRREIDARQFARKAEAYEEIIDTIFSLMRSNDSDQEDNQVNVVDRLNGILPKLMIWAGPEVLNAWKQLPEHSEEPYGPLFAGNRLILALRKELGHRRDASLGPTGVVAVMLRADDRHILDQTELP